MPEELPSELPERVRLSIRAGLVQIHRQRRAPCKKGTETCLDEAYRVFASELSQAGEPLTESLLKEKIPGWVIQWAIPRKWLAYPPQRPRRGRVVFLPGKVTSAYEPIPPDELTICFGPYMVTEHYKSYVMDALEGAIADWEAEAAKRAEAAAVEPQNATGQERKEPQPPNVASGDVSSDRRAEVDTYIEEVFQKTGKPITRTDIWKYARYKTRAEFERWESRWYERHNKKPNAAANKRFTRLLREKPHLK